MSGLHSTLAAEVAELEAILAEIPESSLVERMTFEQRLRNVSEMLRNLGPEIIRKKTRLTFRGQPVVASHGIVGDFGGQAVKSFIDAYTAVVAGLEAKLQYMGPIPDKEKHQLLITGTATGSFGFEFEFPAEEPDLLSTGHSIEEDAMIKLQSLLEKSASGTDDEVTELVSEIHPRAVKKVSEFLEYVSQKQSWCGLEVNGQTFRYQDVDQILNSVARLREENIREDQESFSGEFLGVLPQSRNFEFNVQGEDQVIRGKIGPEFDDPDILNREFHLVPVMVVFQVIQVGQGRPKYTLESNADIQTI